MNNREVKCMNRRGFLRKAALGTVGLAAAPFLSGMGKRREGDPPNIILFLSDDHACRDAGCYGNSVVRTPNLDRLAAQGMRFERAFTVTPTCVPSRASIYTGLGPHRHGSHENHSRIDPGIRTLPHYLASLGYRTLLAGKTHVKPKEAYPFTYLDTGGGWNTEIVTRGSEVAEFLGSEAAREQPFCLVIATNNPHVPWPRSTAYEPAEVPLHPYLLDTDETRKAMANYYGDVSRMDRELGRAMDLLEEQGLADQTALIYTSDHGPQFPHGKWELYDYGIHIPLVVRWPGTVAAGSTSPAMVSSVDLLPTLIQMTGAQPPRHTDGMSFMPVLTGRTSSHRERIFATHTRDLNMNYYPMRAVRDSRYKYIRNLAPERAYTCHITNSNNFEANGGEQLWNSWLMEANRSEEAREKVKGYQHRPAEELYDLENDPAELQNLAGAPELETVKSELRSRLGRWMRQQGDPGRGA